MVKIENRCEISSILNVDSFDIAKFERKIWNSLYSKKKEKYISVNGNWLSDEKKAGCYQIVLYNHFKKQKNSVIDNIKTYKDIAEQHVQEGCDGAIEELSSSAIAKLPFYNKIANFDNYIKYLHQIGESGQPLTEDEFYVANWRLFDAYRSKILVLDERIQSSACEQHKETEGNPTKLTNNFIFKYSNVCIPECSEIKLDNKDDLRAKLFDWCEKKIEERRPNVLLVHYSILERMRSEDKIITNDKVYTIKDLLLHWVSKDIKVVVTSGRGKHSLDLPNDVCFLNLSSVLYAFVENRNKYSINYILNQARR